MVRKVFLLTVLAAGLLYTWSAFMDLSFLSSTGRLGPGFFPRILGTLIVLVTLYTLLVDRSLPEHGETIADEPDPESGNHAKAAAIAIAATGAMIALFDVLGGITSIAVFLAVMLWTFNPRGHLVNVLTTLIVPAGIYFMFDVWLNASIPRSALPFLI